MVQEDEVRQAVKSIPDNAADGYMQENATIPPESADEKPLNETVVQAFETEKQVKAVEEMTDSEKNDRILDLEEKLKASEKEAEDLSKMVRTLKRCCEAEEQYHSDIRRRFFENRARRKSLKAYVLGFAALLGVSGWYHFEQKSQIEAQANEIAGLNADLRTAVWLDESNSKLARAVFVEEIQKVFKQMPDATPMQFVDMGIRWITHLKANNEMAIEGFQIRVISDDLSALARTAEKTGTSSENFLKILHVYADQKPAAYADRAMTQAQGRARLDQLLLRAGCRSHQK